MSSGALGSIWSGRPEEEKEETTRRDPETKLDISHSLKVGHDTSFLEIKQIL